MTTSPDNSDSTPQTSDSDPTAKDAASSSQDAPGAEIGISDDQANSFEPEEDPDAVE